MLIIAVLVYRMAACLNNLGGAFCKYGDTLTINTTVMVEVNMNSPHMGQSHSVLLSMHLCEFSMDMDMHTPHFYSRLAMIIVRGGGVETWQ